MEHLYAEPAKWCRTTYCVRGPVESQKELRNLMSFYLQVKFRGVGLMHGKEEVEALTTALNDSWWEVPHTYDKSYYVLNSLKPQCEETVFVMWSVEHPCTAAINLFKKMWPELRFFFRSEEETGHVYTTNDAGGECFRKRWRTKCCLKNGTTDDGVDKYKIRIEYFEKIEDALRHIGRHMGAEIPKGADDVKSICDSLEDKNEFCKLDHVTFVDDCGNVIPE